MSAELVEPSPAGGDRHRQRVRGVVSAGDALQCRLDALAVAARFHGIQLDRKDFRPHPGEAVPSPAALVGWMRESGLWAKAVRLRWRQLMRLQSEAPIVLLGPTNSNVYPSGEDLSTDSILRFPPIPV